VNEKLKKFPIVCFTNTDWWAHNPQPVSRIMEAFSKHTKVLFVNTISPRIPPIFSSSFLRRLKRKLPSLIRVFGKPMPNFYVFNPLVLPLTGNTLIPKLNHCLLLIQIRVLLFLLGFKRPIFWVENLTAIKLIDRLTYKLLIYVCNDKWDKTRYIKEKETLQLFDEQMVKRAHVILCVSRAIHRYYKEKAENRVYYMPHAVNYVHFSKDRLLDRELPSDIKNIPHPIIGYYGSLTDSNDLDLLFYCAKKRPDWSFVLIGRITDGDFRPLEQLSNVYMLGFKKYEELPLYTMCFDVCLLFWKITEWIKYCSPLKTKEYLAMEKPIVSVPIPEIEEEFSDLISIAHTKENFLNAIEHELKTDNSEKKEKRISRVRGDTWERYVEKVSSILELKLE